MKKNFFNSVGTLFRTSAYVVVCGLSVMGLAACSDDDETGNDGGNGSTATVVNPSQVFTGGIPKQVAGMTISQNEAGLVTSILTEDGDRADFEYLSSATTKADAAQNLVRITATESDGAVTVLDLKLNNDGYVEFCNSTDPSGERFTWEMEYDADDHLVVMKRSESGGEVTEITYENGDVVKTSTLYTGEDIGDAVGDLNGDGVIDENDKIDTEWSYSSTIDYTTDAITTPIENKGNLMLFDETLDVDMDEMIYAYYAGMLGKATKHLPLVQHSTSDGQGSVSDIHFTWTLNADNYPTKLVVKNDMWDWSDDEYTFAW